MGKEQIEKRENYNGWSFLVITLIVISMGLIVFSFFAPSLLVQPSTNSKYDFSQTGAIGDTIGGLMNPFIALAGVVVTFLAFYMQIEANRIQIKHFEDGATAEKRKKILEEKLDCYDKLNILKLDLDSVIKDVELKSDGLERFYKDVMKNPYKSNILMRTPSFNYTRTADLDRLAIYRGFQHFSEDKEWIKHFSDLYRILDFFSESFQLIYDLFDYNKKENFKAKTQITDDINELMSKLMLVYHNSSLASPLKIIVNEVLIRYSNFTKIEGTAPQETDLGIIQTNVLEYFMNEAWKINKDEEFKKNQDLVISAKNIYTSIARVSNYEKQVGSSAKETWENINQEKGGKASLLQKMNEIKVCLEKLLQDNKDILNQQ